jgi:hypothetical protein
MLSHALPAARWVKQRIRDHRTFNANEIPVLAAFKFLHLLRG